jgi:hypothetical protein
MEIRQTVRLSAVREGHRNRVGDSERQRTDVSEDQRRGTDEEGV